MEFVLEDEKRKTVDMSGMGVFYEETCQRMLYVGLQYLDSWLLFGDEEAKFLIQAWEVDPVIEPFGTSPLMDELVLGHLKAIHRLTYKGWIDHIEREHPGRTFLIEDPPTITPNTLTVQETFDLGVQTYEEHIRKEEA